ncbi:MAG: glycosyltransferase [bacterium]|nr:glycosyltransferase [bacterium]
MKILVIGTKDNRGGAAGISWELRKRLKADGHTVSSFVRYKYSNEPDVFVIPRKRYQDWLVKLFANDLRFANTEYIFDTKEYKEADLIHCHNLHSNFFNLHDLIRMSNEKPVVWTLHDLWAITGFSSDSVTLKNPNKKRFLLYFWDNTSHLLSIKKRIYEKSKLYIVTVSEWLKREVKKSVLEKQNITRIYNGVDTLIFKPYDKQSVRKELGLPLYKKIIGFGKKGWNESKEIVEKYENNNDIVFLSIDTPYINKKIIALDHIDDRILMSKYLSALDVFFYPTRGDTFGLIVAEAMACGTPVITYDSDALPEIVSHKETGYVVSPINTENAKKGLDFILNLPKIEYDDICHKARQRTEDLFSLNKMYCEYLDLYKKVIFERG